MPTTTNISVTFDGVTDAVRLPWQSPVSWYIPDSFIGYYSAYNSTPDDKLVATASLSGSNWTVAAMRFGSAFDNKTIVQDIDGAGGRRIDLLKLGDNSDVDLISTSVRFMYGDSGNKHDITLGSGDYSAISLNANVNIVRTGTGGVGSIDVDTGRAIVTVGSGGLDSLDTTNNNDVIVVSGGTLRSAYTRGGDDTITVKDGGRISQLRDTGNTVVPGEKNTITVKQDSRIESFNANHSDNTVTLLDTSRIYQLKLDFGTNTVSTVSGWLESFKSHESSNTVTLGNGTIGVGGASQLEFSSRDSFQTHSVTAWGYLGSLQTSDSRSNLTDDQSTTVTLHYFAGAIRLGNGADVVTTGDGLTGWVELVSTSGGDDRINLGSGGGAMVNGGRGNDIISVKEASYIEEEQGVVIHGGRDVDTLNFKAFTKGVTFSLEGSGTMQEVASGAGYFSEISIENIVGSNKADRLTGDAGVNDLQGKGGNDRLMGGGGNDKLLGDNGNDKLFGDGGKDTLIGGKGRDILEGGKGNDVLRGDAGADVFVFGARSGTDKIKDFDDGTDILRIEGHAGGFDTLTLTLSVTNNDIFIDHDGGRIVIVDGFGNATLTAADFDFV